MCVDKFMMFSFFFASTSSSVPPSTSSTPVMPRASPELRRETKETAESSNRRRPTTEHQVEDMEEQELNHMNKSVSEKQNDQVQRTGDMVVSGKKPNQKNKEKTTNRRLKKRERRPALSQSARRNIR